MATPQRATKAVVWGIIIANGAVFLQWHNFPPLPAPKREAQQANNRAARAAHAQRMLDNFTLSKRNLDQGRWWTLVTAAFSHNNTAHLAVNMFMLHQSADIAAMLGMGPLRWAGLALGSALGGSLVAAANNTRMVVKAGEPDIPGLGASGMVQGAMVATALAAPNIEMRILFMPFTMRYRTVVLAFIALNMYGLYVERRDDRRLELWKGGYLGFAAHLGGSAFGAAFYLLAMRRGIFRIPRRP